MMRVLVNIVEKNIEKTMPMNVNSVKYCENMLIGKDFWTKEETRADGLLIVDYKNRELCIPNVDKETADAIGVELFANGKCDLRQYGICC